MKQDEIKKEKKKTKKKKNKGISDRSNVEISRMKNEVVVLLLLINCHRCKTKKKKANSIRCILSSSLDVTINVQSTDDFTFFF